MTTADSEHCATSAVRVHVLTTDGAVSIRFLGREAAFDGARSIILKEGDTRALPIRDSYIDFVDNFVQRQFHHRFYRADLSGRIDSGESWQLPLLIAHYLYERDDRLAQEDALADICVFATGKLHHRPAISDSDVVAVDSIETKLKSAILEIESRQREGANCLVILPAENWQDYLDCGEAVRNALPPPLFVARFGESLQHVDPAAMRTDDGTVSIDGQDKSKTVRRRAGHGAAPIGNHRSRRFGRAWKMGAAMWSMLLILTVAWTASRQSSEESPTELGADAPPAFGIVLETVRTERRSHCMRALDGASETSAKPRFAPLPQESSTVQARSDGMLLCGFRARISNNADTLGSSKLTLAVSDPSTNSRSPRPIIDEGRVPVGGVWQLFAALPRFRTGAEYWLVEVVVRPTPTPTKPDPAPQSHQWRLRINE